MEIQKNIEVLAKVTVDLVLRHDIIEHFNQLQKTMMTQTNVREMINLWLKQIADATLKSMILKRHIKDNSALTMESDYPSDRVICTLDMCAVQEFMFENNDSEAAVLYKWKLLRLEWLFDALESNITYLANRWDSNDDQILTPYKRTILTCDTSVES